VIAQWLGELGALGAVFVTDLALAGDNVVVVGMAACQLPPQLRRKAIVMGMAVAAVLRVVLSMVAFQLLQIIGLLAAAGLLLLWVTWKLWRDLRVEAGRTSKKTKPAPDRSPVNRRQFVAVVCQIVVADVTMSFDNVVAVAGAARGHPWVMVIGLALSVLLTGCAAGLVAGLLKRWPALAYLGLVVVLFVALRMLWDGGRDLLFFIT